MALVDPTNLAKSSERLTGWLSAKPEYPDGAPGWAT
jgi:hypothetical protein